MSDEKGWLETRHLSRYVLYCLVGPGLPMMLAIFTIPKVVSLLGVERFGILSITWVVLGYFSLFDFGIGRSAVRLYSEYFGKGERSELGTIVSTTIVLTFIFGALGGLVLMGMTPWLIDSIFKVSADLRPEASRTFYLMALTVPFIPMTSFLRGILETHQRFRLTNAIHSFLGTLTYLGPLVVLLFWRNSLTAVVLVLVVARIITFLVFSLVTWQTQSFRRGHLFDTSLLRRLFWMGSWLTVSSIIGPIMVYFDRFLIGALISMSAVAFYSTPYEVVSRFNLLSSAVAQVLFPGMSTFFMREPLKAARLYRIGIIAVGAMLFPALTIVALFAPEGLQLWMGADFSAHSQMVMRVLSVGLFFTSVGQVPFVFLQSAERADLTAKSHIFEVLLYLPAVWWSAKTFGLVGVASIWTLRGTLDIVLMSGASGWLVRDLNPFLRRQALLFGISIALIGAVVLMDLSLQIRFVSFFILVIGFYLGLWLTLMDEEQKQSLRRMLKLTRKSIAIDSI